MDWSMLPDAFKVRLLQKLTSLEMKSVRLTSRSGKEAIDQVLLCLKPRVLSVHKAKLLLAKFPSAHILDCSALDPLAKGTVQTIIKMEKLCTLHIRVHARQAEEMLAIVAKLTNLTCLHFHSEGHMDGGLSDKGLSVLTKVGRLVILDLHGAKSLQGNGFKSLQPLRSLKELHLEKCSGLDGCAFSCVRLLTQLTRLELGDILLDLSFELRGDYGPPGYKGAVERLQADVRRAIRSIMIVEGMGEDEEDMYEDAPQFYPNPQASEWAGERAKFAGFLAMLPKMSTGIDVRSLTNLDADKWSPWLKQHLSRLSGLTSVTVDDYKYEQLEFVPTSSGEAIEAVFGALSSLENLKVLDLRSMAALKGDFWGSLVQLKNLESLKLKLRNTDMAAGGAVSGFSSLKTLEMTFEGWSSEGDLSPLADLPCLETLKLSGVDVDYGKPHIQWPTGNLVTSLRSLRVKGGIDVDNGNLTCFTSLTSLHLSNVSMRSGFAAKLLPGVKHLKALTLCTCYGLSNAALSHLQDYANLTHLDLENNSEVSDEGLGFLADLQSLRVLSLRDTSITPAGLVHLEKLTALQELDIRSEKIVAAADMVQNLRQLIVQHSLARVFVNPGLQKRASEAGKLLPCKWIQALHNV